MSSKVTGQKLYEKTCGCSEKNEAFITPWDKLSYVIKMRWDDLAKNHSSRLGRYKEKRVGTKL